jgi:hypothetical protein
MAKKGNWIAGAIKRPGAFTAKAKKEDRWYYDRGTPNKGKSKKSKKSKK